MAGNNIRELAWSSTWGSATITMLLRKATKTGAALAVALLVASPALACREDKTLFFSRVPRDVDAPVVAQVTVTRTLAEGYYFVGFARVEKVLKGSIEAPTVKLISVPTSCTPGYPVGTSGVVAGTRASLQRIYRILSKDGKTKLSFSQRGKKDRIARRCLAMLRDAQGVAHRSPARGLQDAQGFALRSSA